MKTTKALVTGLAVVLFAACSGNKDGKETADSLNASNDTSAMMTGSDSTGSGAAAMTVSAEDADFAVNAANGGMAEVALGKLARGKAVNQKVKGFADMMASDHTKANEELMALAKSKNISLPATVAEEQMKVEQELSAKSGAEFDKSYVEVQVNDHKKTVELFEKASKDAVDPDLKAFAVKTLPTLKMHLSTIEKIQAGLK